MGTRKSFPHTSVVDVTHDAMTAGHSTDSDSNRTSAADRLNFQLFFAKLPLYDSVPYTKLAIHQRI